jgi:hypothetical protein
MLNSGIAVAPSDHAQIFVILSPAGPYFSGKSQTISILAVGESVRSWPGGTGGHKLALNYSPGFLPQRLAATEGYDQILWLLDSDRKITEAGAMNFFVAVRINENSEFGLVLVSCLVLIYAIQLSRSLLLPWMEQFSLVLLVPLVSIFFVHIQRERQSFRE